MNAKIDAMLQSLSHCGIPACDFIVTHKGKKIYRGSAGFSDVEGTRPVSSDDIYYMYSVSKITTCVAAMRLVEEDRLGLDDPVYKYLPAFRHLTVKEKNVIVPTKNILTIRHLFTMMGGLNYNLNAEPILRAKNDPKADTLRIVNSFAESPLDFEPGTRYQYSLCHDVLAAVVEVVSGMRFADYVKKIVFDPLGMYNTGYHLPESLMPRLSAMYTYINGLFQAKPRDNIHNEHILNDHYDSGGAGLYSSADDQIRLMTVLANGGKTEDGYTLLMPKTIALMQVGELPDCAKPQFGPYRLFGYSWGLCGRVHVDPIVSHSRSGVGEFGWDGAAGSFALVDPAKQVAMFFAMHVLGCLYAYYTVFPTLRDLAYELIEGQ